jgi:hypothetical protein
MIVSWIPRIREPTKKNPTLLGHQSMEVSSPGKVAHHESNSTKVSPYDGGNLCNGDHLFLEGEE